MQQAYILMVEDEEGLRSALQEILGEQHHHVTAAANATRAREAMQNGRFDIAILDVRLPDGDGIDLLREFRRLDPEMGIIMMTGYAEVDTAVESIRLGANDFLKKPFDSDELLIRIEELIKNRRLRQDNKVMSQQLQAAHGHKGFIGQSQPIENIRRVIELVASSESTVLITGESGTGKEVLARMLHQAGPRAKKPMVSINCGAIPEELLESELFGHVKGAFTGAMRARPGRFEVANGGTIFLDEIGDMSPKLQVKLLRVLQERCFEPVGSHQSIEVDVRVIAATHRDLETEIEAGRFREDLFYRLNVVPVHLPPLRERGEDVLLIAEHFMQKFNEERGASITGIGDQAKQAMLHYSWPGNVRELQNLIERVATLKRSGLIEMADLPSKMLGQVEQTNQNFQVDVEDAEKIDLKNLVDEFENHLIISALQRFDWNKNRAAMFLSMNRTTLVEKLKKKNLNANPAA